ncbi:hypothetical protein KPATCC21470_0043 [Kitasatospora purpeofusca]
MTGVRRGRTVAAPGGPAAGRRPGAVSHPRRETPRSTTGPAGSSPAPAGGWRTPSRGPPPLPWLRVAPGGRPPAGRRPPCLSGYESALTGLTATLATFGTDHWTTRTLAGYLAEARTA